MILHAISLKHWSRSAQLTSHMGHGVSLNLKKSLVAKVASINQQNRVPILAKEGDA